MATTAIAKLLLDAPKTIEAKISDAIVEERKKKIGDLWVECK